jgi:hypothetical protein
MEKDKNSTFHHFLVSEDPELEKVIKRIREHQSINKPTHQLKTKNVSTYQITHAMNSAIADKQLIATLNNNDYNKKVNALKAVLYDYGNARWQLTRYSYAKKAAIYRFLDTILNEISNSNVLILFISLRSIYEYISHLCHLSSKIRTIVSSKLDLTLDDLNNINNTVHSYTMQTRLDWESAHTGTIKKYETKPDFQPVNSSSILSSIDYMSKIYAETRGIYEFLCEFAHPNVGGYFVFHTKLEYSSDNKFGPFDVISRTLGINGPYQGLEDFIIPIKSSFRNLDNLLIEFRQELAYIVKIERLIESSIRKYTRKEIGLNPYDWNKREPCTCGSGSDLISCCVPQKLWRSLH